MRLLGSNYVSDSINWGADHQYTWWQVDTQFGDFSAPAILDTGWSASNLTFIDIFPEPGFYAVKVGYQDFAGESSWSDPVVFQVTTGPAQIPEPQPAPPEPLIELRLAKIGSLGDAQTAVNELQDAINKIVKRLNS